MELFHPANLWLHYDSAKKIRPFGVFETRVNGKRPGGCIKFFSFMGWGAALFLVMKNGRFQYDRHTGLVVQRWYVGRITLHKPKTQVS